MTERLNDPGIRTVVLVAALSLGFLQAGWAQGGPAQGTLAQPIPLSGRSGNGSVKVTQSPVPGTTTSVDIINPSVQVQGPYAGSTQGTAKLSFSGKLSLREAIQRGLTSNLGATGVAQAVREAESQRRIARSGLLPNINGDLSETVEKENLKAFGLRITLPIPGFTFPTVVGPFNYMDLRARLSQTVDLASWNNLRSASENLRASRLLAQDTRDLVVLAVGGAYLQAVAAKARTQAARAQLETANALYQQALQERSAGVMAQVDVDRSEVAALTQQQRLLSLQNDLSKQKINLARMTGLPPNDEYDVSDEAPFSAAPQLTVGDALKQAFAQRYDLQAAEAQVSAGDRARSAARSERLPSLSVTADYGAIGTNPPQTRGTYTAVATLRVPIWQGGRTEGDIEQADAALAQRRAELDDTRSQVEADVRTAYLDLQAAGSQVEVARKNLAVARESLDLTRQRFDAGITDAVEVIQAQESVASGELDYINSVFANNVAKLSLARAMGRAADSLEQFLKP